MPPWLLRLAAWRLSRHLSPEQLTATLGDLTEDFDRHRRSRGGLRASVWAVGEVQSVARAYKTRIRSVDRPPRITMGSLLLDETRLAARRLLARPGASLAAALTLACGIAAAAATWSLIDQVLINPIPARDPASLVVVGRIRPPDNVPRYTNSYPFLQAVRARGVLQGIAATGSPSTAWTELVGTGGLPEPRVVFYISHDFFELLGIPIGVGTGFRSDDDRRGAAIRVILSDGFWRRAFGRDPGVVGREITVAGKPATIAGVAPAGFRGIRMAESPDLYLPLHVIEDISGIGSNYFAEPVGPGRGSPTSFMTIVGRVPEGMSHTEAAARLNAAAPPDPRLGTLHVEPLATSAIPEAARAGMSQFTRLLAVTVALLLLTAFLSVGMLLLIRTEARRGEFALCLALGASRARLGRGIALEGLGLSVAGALVAVPIAALLFTWMKTFQLPGNIRIELLELSIGAPVLLAAMAAAIAGALVIGAVAGIFNFSANLADVLRDRGAMAVVGRRRLRSALVVAQVAVALVLLAGGGLFARSLIAALSLNPGFETSRLITGTLSLRPYGYTPPRAAQFFDDLTARLGQHPAITSWALMRNEGGMTPSGQLFIDQVPRQFPTLVGYVAVDPHYFQTMGIRLLAGRNFEVADTEDSAAIVSESFGRLLSNGGDPLGRRIGNSSGSPIVVGVVADVITNVAVLEPLVKYHPLAPGPLGTSATIVMRASRSADAAAGEAVRLIREMNPAITPPRFMTMDERIGAQMGPQQLGAAVLGGLGLMAVLLTIVGTYVLAETMAAARRREIGIRAALGATRQQLGGLILSETTKLVGAGLVVGLALSWLLAGSIRALLYRVQPLDATTLAVTALTILVLAVAVSLRPAIVAARANLSRILREE